MQCNNAPSVTTQRSAASVVYWQLACEHSLTPDWASGIRDSCHKLITGLYFSIKPTIS